MIKGKISVQPQGRRKARAIVAGESEEEKEERQEGPSPVLVKRLC